MSFEYHVQPLKGAFLLWTVFSTLLIYLPYWLISSLKPSWRPRSSWGWGRVFGVHVLQVFVHSAFKTGLPAAAQSSETAEKAAKDTGFVWLAPTPDLVVGEIKTIAESNDVQVQRVPAYWYGSRGSNGEVGQKAGQDEKIVYQLHGGGYVMGHAGPKDLMNPAICCGFIEHIGQVERVFSVEYRLSSADPFKPANPFPTALIDAIAGYSYLISTVGFRPENIIISGDSAGGNLAISLTRYLVSSGLPAIPPPGLLLLLSPTTEWVLTHVGPDSSLERNTPSDYCRPFFDGYPAKALVGKMALDEASTNIWISPGSLKAQHVPGTFAGFPPTCINAGEAEFQLDSVATFRRRLVADIGAENVTYIETFGGTHDFIGLAMCEPERTEALREISAWVMSAWPPTAQPFSP
ncbi:alpha/beta-hydrolase [Amylostereum chailletii]|nr:alpha/beta-hydrolase [Amylostereum chailletii]